MRPAPASLPDLPIDEILGSLLAALDAGTRAVLQAPPGAGKTTKVPLALLDAPWLQGRKIMVLEPRRIAARAAARRMAAMLGEEVGETVGYRVRLDSRVGPRTRIEVVTEGILVRMLQADPSLAEAGAVLLDEFHERSLDADLALALCLEAQGALRDDLRLVVMSATLDGARVAALLDDAPILTSAGRAFPVETRYLDRAPAGRVEDGVAGTVRRALADEPGSVLAFLPGVAEIRRAAGLLEGAVPPDVLVAPLYGDLSAAAQDEAIRPPPPGRRKVVLATSIAETSLTIEGIRIVVDGGQMRRPRFDPRTGMTRLETLRVSQAAADQRRGRAGRLEPGVCYRLWTEPEQRALPPHSPPEILEADLAPLALELAQWGVGSPDDMAWLDPPPPAAYAQATTLLAELGALDADGRIMPHGREMAGLGVHPRLAHMMLAGRRLGLGALAADVAALLGERDVLRGGPGADGRDADLTTRVDLLQGRERGLAADRGALAQVRQSARQYRQTLGVRGEAPGSQGTGLLVAHAYPDRIAQRRSGATGQFRLANGRGAVLPPAEPLAAADFLAVADLDAGRADARIFRAAPLTRAEIEEAFADRIEESESVAWEPREEAVLARRQRRLGALILEERRTNPPPERTAAAMIEGIRQIGPAALPWTDELRNWQARVGFLHRLEPESWPDVSDAALMESLEDWLAPFLGGLSRRAHLARLDLKAALTARLDWNRKRALDALAPTHLVVPSGSRIPIDYSGGEPVLAVRLQEMFGATETPTIAGGRAPLLLHLLSPARRPVQVTRDLKSFWANGYPEVKRDLKGQYPKHYWPDDPLQAEPTSRAKPRGT